MINSSNFFQFSYCNWQKQNSLKPLSFICSQVHNLTIIELAHILFTKEDTVKNVLSQSSKASIQFCATIRVLRWCLEAILLMQRCVLDPNSAQKRARELRHLCAMMNETLLIESHWINLFFHHKWFLFDNHNHFNTSCIKLCYERFSRVMLAILVLAFYIQIKL